MKKEIKTPKKTVGELIKEAKEKRDRGESPWQKKSPS